MPGILYVATLSEWTIYFSIKPLEILLLIGINHKSESNDCLLDQVLNKVYLTNYYTIFS